MTISLRRFMVYIAYLIMLGDYTRRRLYLGIHWFTDILAGTLLGLGVLLFCSYYIVVCRVIAFRAASLCAIFFFSADLRLGKQNVTKLS